MYPPVFVCFSSKGAKRNVIVSLNDVALQHETKYCKLPFPYKFQV